ncbi:CT847 family type III secretion system effector [Chlamydia suis]|uniref:CT847 family type III secretion system effector n=1 Tax=Chlamydia suis TaxID=83559 RepID=UPI0009AFC00E|nr:CT847 family type III secretion system effector [Chlamydia suis]
MSSAIIPTLPEKNIVIPDSTLMEPTSIEINKQSAMYFCIAVMLQLSISTTDYSHAIMAVLQENTLEQQRKTKELINIPLLYVPSLEKKQNSDEYTNNTTIQAFQTSNQQITANRELIQQELSAAQQRAQANQKSVNATSSESMQILQAVSALLSSLVDLTIKANLTTSPSD